MKHKISSNKSEVRLALVFRKFDKVASIKKKLRLNAMLTFNKNVSGAAYKMAIEK